MILVGDVSQLQAVENGGGMSLLVGALGYPRLAEPGGPNSQSSARHTKRKAESEPTVITTHSINRSLRPGQRVSVTFRPVGGGYAPGIRRAGWARLHPRPQRAGCG